MIADRKRGLLDQLFHKNLDPGLRKRVHGSFCPKTYLKKKIFKDLVNLT